MSNHAKLGNKFSWDAFDEFFSTSNIMKSQGQYETLVLDAIKQISNYEDKVSLISLLDLRLISLLQLMDCFGGSYTDKSGTLIFDDAIAARLQINNTISWTLKLPRKGRDRLAAMLEQYESYL